jgi:hypothetical protein
VDPSCLAKTDAVFANAFARGRCPGSAAPFASLADACDTLLLSHVPGNGKCQSSSTKAIGSGAGAALGCSAKDIKRPGSAPPCRAKAAAKLSAKLGKIGACIVPGFQADIDVCVQTIEANVR